VGLVTVVHPDSSLRSADGHAAAAFQVVHRALPVVEAGEPVGCGVERRPAQIECCDDGDRHDVTGRGNGV
jgi:hypothetical protein